MNLKKWIIAEWIDDKNEYHSGLYPLKDKKELEKKLNEWANNNKIKSFDFRKPEKNSIWELKTK